MVAISVQKTASTKSKQGVPVSGSHGPGVWSRARGAQRSPFLSILNALRGGVSKKAEATSKPELTPKPLAAGAQVPRALDANGKASLKAAATEQAPQAKKHVLVRQDEAVPDTAAVSAALAQARTQKQPERQEARDGAEAEGPKDAAKTQARKKDDKKLSVIDLRMKADQVTKEQAKPQAGKTAGSDDQGAEAVRAEPDRAKAAWEPGQSEPSKAGSGPSFSELLAARLKSGGSADIVRAAQVVLRDGDLGVIRLRLEPESLGGVKIELKMAEKQISGRIVVESDLAGEAFRSSLDSLKDAFAASGFETTSLEVEVRGGNQGGGEQTDGRLEQGGPYWSSRFRELEAAVPPADAYAPDSAVDLVV